MSFSSLLRSITSNRVAREKALPAAPRFRPTLELLEDRCVPSTATVDLTTAGTTGAINGAFFQQTAVQPTGVGVIHDFVRIQAHDSGAAVEQGYNTDARPLQFDEKTSPPFTHSIHLSDVPVTTIGGVAYREFLLGVNQSSDSPLLSLDQLKLFVGARGDLTGYDANGMLAGQPAVYDMNAGGASNWVALNAALTHGNGSGDMYLYVPDQVFAAAGNPNPFVYLYSEFGAHYGSNGGFEQWALRSTAGSSGDSLSGFVFGTNNVPLAGVQLTLTWTNAQGQAVTFTTTTNSGGSYTFTGLLPGTYTVSASLAPGYTSIADQVGTVNGATDGNALSSSSLGNIALASGNAGVNYDFFESVFAGS
jgi:hypothetical protein